MDAPPTPSHHDMILVEETVGLVEQWLEQANRGQTRREKAAAQSLSDLIEDPDGIAFTMRFIDRVARPGDAAVAAHQLARLVESMPPPEMLGRLDRLLLRAGAVLAPRLPDTVVPLAMRRMRQLVGHLVVDAAPEALAAHLDQMQEQGFAQNVNLLGEAVLGEREADRRLQAAADLVAQPGVDYVSIKVSAIASQLNHWDWPGSLERVVSRLRPLFRRAVNTSPPTFVNLDMEEYHDLALTVAAFKQLLDERDLRDAEAGIVLQAYLPDSFAALRDLVTWATARRDAGGAGIKIRLVKGANLAMERVDATIHGWEQAPYATKAEVDANYKRCLDWVLRKHRARAVRIGVASHNLFDVAWAHLLSHDRGVADRVEIEMLHGMAPAQARTVKETTAATAGQRLLLYTPIVGEDDFDVAIGYLFRRLEENSATGNFLRALHGLRPGTTGFDTEAMLFRQAVADRWSVGARPRRSQQRPARAAFATEQASPAANHYVRELAGRFTNEPDTDPALPTSRQWAASLAATPPEPVATPVTRSTREVAALVDRARTAAGSWASTSAGERRSLLHAVADELARNRGALVSAMMHEANKTLAEADPEVSEAIDFARYYGDRALDLNGRNHVRFEPLGTVAVISPWNFPVAICTGGVTSALAAGNALILKPAPETPRCAEIVAECCWAAGVPTDVLQFARVPEDSLGRRLVTSVDGVVLTGSIETARLFLGWKPDLKLLAETSGKNSLVITPQADLDLAVADLVRSAFGHSGQKCSAASLAICVGDVYDSPRFRRQLVDAVESLQVGWPDDLGTMVGPLIGPPGDKLARGLSRLDDGEEWLVEPRQIDDSGHLWRPGVRLGVAKGSWFHQNECFGPVLGLMAADDLDEAIALQNATDFGLTAGLHTLDPAEVDTWLERVQAGNAYVNRHITGAIVQRQPFGGWKRSSVGPGAKAGGPNYVAQLGTWHPRREAGTGGDHDQQFLIAAAASDHGWWSKEFSVEHDPSGLFCEANLFRYRPLPMIAIRVGRGTREVEVKRVLAAAAVCGVPTLVSTASEEHDDDFIARLTELGLDRARVLGEVTDRLRELAASRLVHLADDPVTANGQVELRHYLREQSVSHTLHRFGNLVATD